MPVPLDVDDLRDQYPGRPENPAAGLEDQPQTGGADDREDGGGVFVRGQGGAAGLVRQAESAAKIEMIEPAAAARGGLRQIGNTAGGVS